MATVILEGKGLTTDKDSLRSFSNMIDSIAGCREEKAYRTRLRDMTRILVAAVDAAGDSRKRRKTIHTGTSMPSDSLSPQSHIHAPPAATNEKSELLGGRDNGFVSLSSWGHDHQQFDISGIDGLVLQNWDDPFTLATTGSSATVDLSPDAVVSFSNTVENWLASSNLGRSQNSS